MEVTFGAVGDFISVVVIIRDILSALNDSRGSSRDFQELTQSLKVMEKALEELHGVFNDPRVPIELDSLQSVALDTARQITCRLTEFRQKIDKYSTSLAHNGSGNPIKDTVKKIQWKLEEGEVSKFRGEIAGYTASLKILLHAVTVQLIKCSQINMQQHLGVIETRMTATIKQQAQSLHDLLGQFTNRVSLALQTVSSIGDDLKMASSRIIRIGSVVYSELRGLRSLVMRLERPVIEEHFTLDDAIGRQIPIHLRAITSWDTLEHIIREQFKGRNGEGRVARRRYALQDHATRTELSSSTPWNRAFRPYQKVNMSILCKEMPNDSHAKLATSCPSCHHVSASEESTEIQCENCNMFYTRVIEIEEIDTEEQDQHLHEERFREPSLKPSSLVPQRLYSGRQGGSKYSKTSERRRQRRKRIRLESQDRRYGSAEKREESDSESDEDDVNGLVRVRVILKQRKMKGRRAFALHNSSRLVDLPSTAPSQLRTLASTNTPTSFPPQKKTHVDQTRDETCEDGASHMVAGAASDEDKVEGKKRSMACDTDEDGLESLFKYTDVGDRLEHYMIHDRIFQLSPPTQYWAPIDEDQKECYDVAHHFLKMVKNNRLFEAPLGDNPSRILDLGTGTGIWAMDMAEEYPLAEVMGTDICLIQPTWVPPNCTFYIEDAESEWKDPNASLDFVHIRALYGGVSDWPQLYREAHEVLVPGGWIEHLEFDITPYSEVSEIMDDEDHIFNQWSKALLDAMDRTGRTGRIGMGGNIRKYLEGTGFVDIVEKTYRIPCGRWGKDEKQKEIGDYCQHFMDMGLEGFALRLLKETMGWEYAEITKIVDRMRSALRDKRTQAYFLVTNVYAKRPELLKGQMTTCLCYCHAGTAGENGSGRRRRLAAKGVHEDAAGGLADVKHCNEVSIEGLQPSM